ncbi:MAG TPA: hemolysin III family protein [Actinomycetes bacterium]|nr:hemolysin III family protein [Actinomycetes bacterium]
MSISSYNASDASSAAWARRIASSKLSSFHPVIVLLLPRSPTGLWRGCASIIAHAVRFGRCRGLAYTLGAVVYARCRPDPAPAVFGYHEVFHLLVGGGVAAHFAAITLVVVAA